MTAFKTFPFALGNKITLPVVPLFIPRNPQVNCQKGQKTSKVMKKHDLLVQG